MSTRYQAYLVQDGKTRLNQAYFNPVWQDLDSRLDKLEQLKASWEAATQELKEFGLERIDATLVPVLEAAQEQLTESQAILTELQALIADADIPALMAAAQAEIQAELDTALAAQTALLNDALSDQQAQIDGLIPLIFAGL